MSLTRLLVDDSSMPADLHRLTAVSLVGCDDLDAAVPVPVVVPVDEQRQPLISLLFGGKWLARLIRPLLHRPEIGFLGLPQVGGQVSGPHRFEFTGADELLLVSDRAEVPDR
jgi:hypothetical protein